MQNPTTNDDTKAVSWVQAPRSAVRHLATPDGQLTLCGLLPLFRARWNPPRDPCGVCLREADRHGLTVG